MKHGNLTWLVWKEYRQHRLIVLGMLFLLALPYVVFPIMACVVWLRHWEPYQGLSDWLHLFHGASQFSFWVSQIALLVIGGNVIASERIDRSAEFQSNLPISRWRSLAGKVLLVLLMFAAIWLPDAAVFWGTRYESWRNGPMALEYTVRMATAGVTFFCVAWFISSLLNSPAIAVCAGLVAPWLAWALVWLAMWAHGFEHYAGKYVATSHGCINMSQAVLEFWAHTTCLTVSAICFVLGAWLYLRRAES